MIARIWWFLVSLFDWRTNWRKIIGVNAVDAVFISNLREEKDRENLGSQCPVEGHFNGPRLWLNNFVSGRVRVLNVTTDEMLTKSGRRKAQEQFLSATRWAEKNGANVILLAAATKRLFDEIYISKIVKEFPEILFTIGDNGTMFLLKQETLRALSAAGLKPGYCRIGVLGPYGFLGEMMTKELKNLGYDIVGVGQNEGGLESVREKYGVVTCKTIAEMGLVDEVAACTHSEAVRLTAENIKKIRREGKKLLLLDVSEPSNMTKAEYEKSRDYVIRQDAGNAYSPKLKYVLGAISYRLFRLTRGVTFGCFAEALALAAAIKRGENVRNFDWLNVSDKNMNLVAEMFKREGFVVPSPRCFGKSVKNFGLDLESKQKSVKSPSWKLAMDKLHLL